MVVKELFAKLGLELDEASFEAGEALIHGLKGGLFGLVAGAGAVVAGLLEMARETANAGFEASKTASRLGITTQALQELNFAAEETGVSAESLQTSIFRMSRTIEEAKEGSVEARKAFTGLHLNLTDLFSEKPDEQFGDIAEALSKVSDQGKKSKDAQAIFGRGVVEILPLLNKGKEGIEEFRKEAVELGLVMSDETIQDSKEFTASSKRLGAQMDALKFKVGAFVLHGLVAMGKAWTNFKKQHAETILKVITDAVIFLTAMTVAYALANTGAIGAAIASYVALGAAALWAGIKMAAAWIGTIAPIAAAAVGVIFLGLALEDVYHFFKGDKATLIGKLIGIWKDDFHSLADVAKSFLGTLKEIVSTEASRKKDHDDERAKDADEAAAINEKTRQRRLERGVIDANGNTTAFAPFSSPAAAFSPAAVAPQAAPALGSGVLAPQLSAPITIVQQPGQDAKELAGRVRTAIQDFHETKMREAAAAVER